MSNEFQIGDRVECVACTDLAAVQHVGHAGTVRCLRDGYVGVEFDDIIIYENGDRMGHNLDGEINSCRGWFCIGEELVALSETFCAVDDLL